MEVLNKNKYLGNHSEPVEDLQPKKWNGHLSFPSGKMPKFRKA